MHESRRVVDPLPPFPAVYGGQPMTYASEVLRWPFAAKAVLRTSAADQSSTVMTGYTGKPFSSLNGHAPLGPRVDLRSAESCINADELSDAEERWCIDVPGQ